VQTGIIAKKNIQSFGQAKFLVPLDIKLYQPLLKSI